MRLPTKIVFLLTLASFLGACTMSGGGPGTEGSPPGEGGSSGGTSFVGEDPGMDFIEEVLYFFGTDRPAVRALQQIRDCHDLSQWTHPITMPDAVERCRDAVRDLAESDYETWDDTAISVWVLSTMAVRDPSALVRNDCVEVLRWFRGWVHPDAEAVGAAVVTTEEDVARALRVMQDIHEDREPHGNAAERLVCMDAIAVLGSHPWDRLPAVEPAVIRTRLSRPRGVIRFLTAPGLEADRADPLIRDTLNRALVRLTDQVILLTEISALADRAGHVRAEAARALAEAGDPRAAGPLRDTLEKEQRDEVVRELIDALGALAGGAGDQREPAVAALARRLSDPVPSTRSAAARALESITGRDLGASPVRWQRWWRERAEENGAR